METTSSLTAKLAPFMRPLAAQTTSCSLSWVADATYLLQDSIVSSPDLSQSPDWSYVSQALGGSLTDKCNPLCRCQWISSLASCMITMGHTSKASACASMGTSLS